MRVFGKSPGWFDGKHPAEIDPACCSKEILCHWFGLYFPKKENHEQTCPGIHTDVSSETQFIKSWVARCIDEQSACLHPVLKLSAADISPPYLRLKTCFSSYRNLLIQHTLTVAIDSLLKTPGVDVCVSGMERQNLAEPVPWICSCATCSFRSWKFSQWQLNCARRDSSFLQPRCITFSSFLSCDSSQRCCNHLPQNQGGHFSLSCGLMEIFPQQRWSPWMRDSPILRTRVEKGCNLCK